MPTIAWFYGITIRMFYNDHAPPHFHAYVGGHEALVAIGSGQVIRGGLPPTARRLVTEWAARYHAELMADWALAHAGEPLERIPGLDDDER